MNIPATWRTLFDALDPDGKDPRQLILAGPLNHYILAGWNREKEMWHASHWESWHKHGECLTVDHAGMVRWCEETARNWSGTRRHGDDSRMAEAVRLPDS